MSSSPIPLPKQVRLEVAQGCVQLYFQYVYGRRQCLLTFIVKKKKKKVQIEFHVVQFVPVDSCPVTGSHREESVTLFFFLSR